MPSIIVYAPNVGSGGGLALLRALLGAWSGEGRRSAILDKRGQSAIVLPGTDCNVHWVRSSIGGRWGAERLLAKLAQADDIILCFHSLPPVLPIRGRVFCFVQNANLVGLIPTSHLSGWIRIRYTAERFIARRFRRRVDRYIVQTPGMAAALASWYGADAPPIDVMPFASLEKLEAAPVALGEPAAPQWDFLYVSDGPVHKNHLTLFDAWQLLAEQGHFPTLALTLHPVRDSALRERLRVLVERTGVAIVDLGQLPHAEVLQAYGQARALLFASYAESFGIPLMEAKAAGLPILAAELDFVRDVCEPAVTFDPFSARSIARAVQRFLYNMSSAVEPMSADAFVAKLIETAGKAKS